MARVPAIPQSLRRTCRDVLATASYSNGNIVFGLMSSTPSEGVSTVTIGLARILAESFKVLVIDASGGRPISELVNVQTPVLGPEELSRLQLSNTESGISSCTGFDFDLLAIRVDQVSSLNWNHRWSTLKLMLMQRYQVILVDLGSLEAQYSPFWNSCVDHTYLVVDMSRTSVEALQRARQELDFLRLPITGAILNRRPFAVPAFLGGSRP